MQTDYRKITYSFCKTLESSISWQTDMLGIIITIAIFIRENMGLHNCSHVNRNDIWEKILITFCIILK